jgi:hypothetical protein
VAACPGLTLTLDGETPTVKSVTVIWTVAAGDKVTPLLVTVRVSLLVPNGQVTVGLTPLAVSQVPVQLKVKGHPVGSEDPLPSSRALAPLELVPLTVWLGPALALGMVRLAAAKASMRP